MPRLACEQQTLEEAPKRYSETYLSIRELALAGMRPVHIAPLIGRQRNYVARALCDMRRAGEPIPRFTSGPPPVRLRTDRLIQAARERNISLSELTAKLLDRIAADDLVDAVLDDGDR